MLLNYCSLLSCRSPLISKQFYLLEEWGQLNLEKGLGSEARVILCPFTNIQYLNPTIVPWNVKPSSYIPKWYQQKTNQSTNRKLIHNYNHLLRLDHCDSWSYNAKLNHFWLLTEDFWTIRNYNPLVNNRMIYLCIILPQAVMVKLQRTVVMDMFSFSDPTHHIGTTTTN